MYFENKNAFIDVTYKNGLNLFLGAGFSVLSENIDGSKLLLGKDLKDFLINHFLITYKTQPFFAIL